MLLSGAMPTPNVRRMVLTKRSDDPLLCIQVLVLLLKLCTLLHAPKGLPCKSTSKTRGVSSRHTALLLTSLCDWVLSRGLSSQQRPKVDYMADPCTTCTDLRL